MLNCKSNQRPRPAASAFGLENLEGRRLLSASVHHHGHAAATKHSHSASLVTSSGSTSVGSKLPTTTTLGGISPVSSIFHIIQFQNAPAAVQATMQANAPVGVTISPTQNVGEITTKTTTDYTLSLSNDGTRTTITVNSSGTLVNLDTNTTIQFSAAPSAVQAGMQALAPSGVTISPTQNVIVNTLNGVTTYMAIILTGKKVGLLGMAKIIIVNAEGDPINNGISAL